MIGSWSGDWITEEDMYPRMSEENYEDIGTYSLYEYWEDFKREEYEGNN